MARRHHAGVNLENARAVRRRWIASFYDQTHPRQSFERIVGFRKKE
jgi:hypothetical protein